MSRQHLGCALVAYHVCCVRSVLSDVCASHNSTVLYCTGTEYCCGTDRCCSRDYRAIKIAVVAVACMIFLVTLLQCYITRRMRAKRDVSVRLQSQSVVTITVAPPTVPRDATSTYAVSTATSPYVTPSTKIPYESLNDT